MVDLLQPKTAFRHLGRRGSLDHIFSTSRQQQQQHLQQKHLQQQQHHQPQQQQQQQQHQHLPVPTNHQNHVSTAPQHIKASPPSIFPSFSSSSSSSSSSSLPAGLDPSSAVGEFAEIIPGRFYFVTLLAPPKKRASSSSSSSPGTNKMNLYHECNKHYS